VGDAMKRFRIWLARKVARLIAGPYVVELRLPRKPKHPIEECESPANTYRLYKCCGTHPPNSRCICWCHK